MKLSKWKKEEYKGVKIMKEQIRKLDKFLNGKASELFNECLEKEIREIKKKEFLFDDFG